MLGDKKVFSKKMAFSISHCRLRVFLYSFNEFDLNSFPSRILYFARVFFFSTSFACFFFF